MKRIDKGAAALVAILCVVATAGVATAQEQLAANAPQERTYDKRIEAAAIKRAGEKIGDLRGSLIGLRTDRIIAPQDLERDSVLPGFPIIQPETQSRSEDDRPVPLV